MDSGTRRYVNQCIREIDSIINEIRKVSSDVANNAQGIDTTRFQRELEETARKYQKAASNLRKLK